MPRAVALSLLLFSLPLAAGSARAADPDRLLTGYLTSWIEGDGLPLGSVHSIVQDRDGYLWVGADAGLFRFDGLRFTSWDAISDEPLPKSPVSALCVARDGSLWVGFADSSGVRRIRDGRVLPRDRPLPQLGSVTALVEDHQGTLWAIGNSVLYRLNGDRWQKLTLPWPGSESLVLQVYTNAAGALWVGTARGLFQRIADTDDFRRVAPGYTWDVSEGADGTMWVTDIAAGFRRLGEPAARSRSLQGGGYRLMHDRQGNLWVATLGEGLWRVRQETRAAAPVIEKMALRTGLSSNTVQSLLEDRDGNIWVGTTAGLHRLRQQKLTPIENIGFVIAVAPDDRAGVWAGTTDGVVELSKTSTKITRGWPGSGPIVLALDRDVRGTLWMGTTDGLWRADERGVAPVRLPAEHPATPISMVTSDARGVWLGYNNWLFHWDGAHVVRLDLPPDSGLKRIAIAQADKMGRLWLASDDGKLGFVDPETHFHPVGPSEGLGANIHHTISTIFSDDEGMVWIGGDGGLSRFENGRVVSVRLNNGLPGNRISSIVQDAEGYLWLMVDRGLMRLHRDEFQKAAASATHRPLYRLYDSSDGIAGAPIGSIRSTRGSDGRLWFVRGGGLTVVDPSMLGNERRNTSAPVRIEAAVANERRFSPTAGASLPAGTTRLQISFTALTLSGSNTVRFRYRLDGLDTKWIEAGTRRSAFYTNLSPRRYQFRVETDTEDGTSSPSTAAWDFVIQPSFYQTQWFLAGCVGMAGMIMWTMWRVRLKRVRREFSLVLAERARLSREIHDTLLQSLVGVALQFQGISKTLDLSPAAAKGQLVRVRQQVEAYIREARQSISDLRSPLLETCDLGTVLRDFAKKSAADHAVRVGFTVTGVSRQCSAKVENQLLRIGQEAITNAVRHGQAKRIDVELHFDDRSVTLRVSDDGRGFDYEHAARQVDGHYGLTTMKERAEEMGGQFTIATHSGQGTAVEAVVPVPFNA